VFGSRGEGGELGNMNSVTPDAGRNKQRSALTAAVSSPGVTGHLARGLAPVGAAGRAAPSTRLPSLCASSRSPHRSPAPLPRPVRAFRSSLSRPGPCPAPTRSPGQPGALLQPGRNAAGLVGEPSFLAFHCSLLVWKRSAGGGKQERLALVEERWIRML